MRLTLETHLNRKFHSPRSPPRRSQAFPLQGSRTDLRLGALSYINADPLSHEIKTGKTWVLWQVDRGDTLPIGLPKLMMVANKDGEWDPKLFLNREARWVFFLLLFVAIRSNNSSYLRFLSFNQWSLQDFGCGQGGRRHSAPETNRKRRLLQDGRSCYQPDHHSWVSLIASSNSSRSIKQLFLVNDSLVNLLSYISYRFCFDL